MKILDTDHWVAVLRGKLSIKGRSTADEDLAITTISIGELSYGAARSSRRADNLEKLGILINSVIVLPYDRGAAHRFGIIKADLEREGRRLDSQDLAIACIALDYSALLVSHNVRHIERVPELRLEDWLA